MGRKVRSSKCSNSILGWNGPYLHSARRVRWHFCGGIPQSPVFARICSYSPNRLALPNSIKQRFLKRSPLRILSYFEPIRIQHSMDSDRNVASECRVGMSGRNVVLESPVGMPRRIVGSDCWHGEFGLGSECPVGTSRPSCPKSRYCKAL